MAIAPVLFPEVEGPEFIEGPGLASVAEEVLHRHGAAGGIGRLFNTRLAIRDEQIRVLYLINTKPFDPMKDDITHDAIAKTVKAPRLWHDVTGYDAVIWARSYFWDQFTAEQQAAVALHELIHLDVEFDDDGQPKLRLRKHDVEDFNEVIRYYGAFLPSRARFFEAFGLWQEGRGKPEPAEPAEPTGITSITIKDLRTGRSVTASGETFRKAADDPFLGEVNPDGCPWPGCTLDSGHAHLTPDDDTADGDDAS